MRQHKLTQEHEAEIRSSCFLTFAEEVLLIEHA